MNEIIHGDCLEKMKAMKAESIDAIVTDPPYGLSFMGKRWDYGVPSEAIWRECLRVLKPGGHLLAFAGTRTQHRMAVRIEDAGFEIRDMIAWVYGSGFPKSHNLGNGWGTALKPALEPITLARKPIDGTVAANVLEHGTGALNVDGCRVGTSSTPRKDPKNGNLTNAHMEMRPWMKARIKQGLPLKGDFDGNQGRWPANLIHDGSEEVVGLFPETGASTDKPRRNTAAAHNQTASMGKAAADWVTHGHSDAGGSAARFFYCAKASKADRDEGCDHLPEHQEGLQLPRGKCPKCNTWKNAGEERCGCGSEWEMTSNPPPKARNNHPTVKPTALMRYLVRLVTPPGGTVLDPFMGSGSTGKAAMLEGFNFIGIEREAEYVEIAKARIGSVEPVLNI